MAAARDQAARILRVEPETAEGGFTRDVATAPLESLRAHLAEEPIARRTSEMPDRPVTEEPASVRAMASSPEAPKSGKR